MRLITVLAIVVFAGCSTVTFAPLKEYADANRPLAENGSLKWSDYYKGAYQRAEQTPSFTGKGDLMNWTNFMISASNAYEANQITKERFEYFQRSANAEMQKVAEGHEAERQRRFQQAMQGLQQAGAVMQQSGPSSTGQAIRMPVQTNCSTYAGQTRCTTN